jgi:hypothetical protein
MSGNTRSDLQLFNAALLRLGETKLVTAVDGSDTSKFGAIAGSEYYQTRDEELRAHTWKFAVKRQKLVSAYADASGSWGSASATLTLTGITLITFTATAALVAASDLQSRTLSAASLTPTPAWVGKSISGTGIPAGTIVEGVDWIAKTVRLSKKVTASGAGVTFVLSPVRVGWLVTTGLAAGGNQPAVPAGIPSGTFVIAVVGNTITMSELSTAAGSASVCLQADNKVGAWYVYNAPADALRDTQVYVLMPTCSFLWPFGDVEKSSVPSKHEGAVVYTNLDPDNAYIAYIAQITDAALFDSLFADALVCRLASKIALYVTGGDKLMDRFASEYMALLNRAQTYNLAEMDIVEEGNPFWTDREGW